MQEQTSYKVRLSLQSSFSRTHRRHCRTNHTGTNPWAHATLSKYSSKNQSPPPRRSRYRFRRRPGPHSWGIYLKRSPAAWGKSRSKSSSPANFGNWMPTRTPHHKQVASTRHSRSLWNQTGTRAPSREHREQPLPGTFIPDTPERPSRSRSAREHPEWPDPLPPAPDPLTGTMTDQGLARLPPAKVPKPPMIRREGENLKPDKLRQWHRTIKKYQAKSGLKVDTHGVAYYYGFYTEGKANNVF